ncbi:MAG: GTPase HflX [Dehalococcoidales bacterium]|nr:GTPase HflX [Dehalococcoidales bacterium]
MELAELAKAAGAQVVGTLIQKLTSPSKIHYIGTGKLDELAALKETTDYNVVVVDDELSPLQQSNLEKALKVKIIDRVALILDIFSRRARTREGRLQVELAQHEYLLPRLAGQWSHLERLGGGIGTRGPGESQLETDRRLIRQKITRLKTEIESIRRHRNLYRQQRQQTGVPVVALVGYTNTGKSTLLNKLCRADVIAKDEPFTTLDPTTRRLTLPDLSFVLLTDTVGFIRKLPPAIVTAFRATLEELAEASLLIHVVDLSAKNAAEQCQTVESILKDLELADKPRITVLNKIDLRLPEDQNWDEASAVAYLSDQCPITGENMVFVSATKGWGLTRLLNMVSDLTKSSQPVYPT